jgi:hypothetical protein
MNANGIWTLASISEFSHDQNVITDRASKHLQRNQLVIATARPGPCTDIEHQGWSLTVHGYVLNVYLNLTTLEASLEW